MRGMKLVAVFLVIVLLAYGGAWFIKQNDTPVSIAFFGFQSPSMSVGFVVLTCLLCGMVFAVLLTGYEIVALNLQIKLLQKKNDTLKEKLLSAAPPSKDSAVDLSPHSSFTSSQPVPH